jgi:signal peptidase I
MEPTFHTHEYLIVDEISYRIGKPARGDVIVFRYPRNPQEYFIKRLIGLPGETVEIKNGNVYIYNDKHPNGIVLEEEYLDPDVETHGFSQQKVELEQNEYFMLGDNRNSSKDSRNFGPVKESFIVGQVFFRGWPFDKAGFFENPEYDL